MIVIICENQEIQISEPEVSCTFCIIDLKKKGYFFLPLEKSTFHEKVLSDVYEAKN